MRSFLTCPEGDTMSHTRAGQRRSQGVRHRTRRPCEENSQVQGSIPEKMSRTQGGLFDFSTVRRTCPRTNTALVTRRCFQDLDPPSTSPSNGAMPSSLSSSNIPSTSDIVPPLSTRLRDRNRNSVQGAPLGRMPSTTSSLTGFTRQSNAKVTNLI